MDTQYTIDSIKFISHEIKNQLSICELYAEIIKKSCMKNNIFDLSIIHAIECIKNSVKISNNSLLELKACDRLQIDKLNIELVIKEAVNLAKVYALQKEISVETQIKTASFVMIDKIKFMATVINIIKNACEAFEEDDKEKKITVSADYTNNGVKILISNNAKPIEHPEKVFNEEFTTKTSGNGLGLMICKLNLKKMGGTIRLVKSDDLSTEFEIVLPDTTTSRVKN